MVPEAQGPSSTPPRAEEEHLARIRKRRLCVWALFLFMPVVWLVPAEWQGGTALLWLVAFAVAWPFVSFSRCPRCRNFFHKRPGVGFTNVWTQCCLGCGLPLRSRLWRVTSS